MLFDRRSVLRARLSTARVGADLRTGSATAAGTLDVDVLFSLTGGLTIIEESLHDVMSNVVGDSVVSFYLEHRNQGVKHAELPICATVTSEIEVAAIGAENAVGSYTSFTYFQAIDTPTDKASVQRYRGCVKSPNAVTHHALEFAYFQVFFWKQAVEKAKEYAANGIRTAIRAQEFNAPGGQVKVEPENLHTWLTPRIAQWQEDGQGKIVTWAGSSRRATAAAGDRTGAGSPSIGAAHGRANQRHPAQHRRGHRSAHPAPQQGGAHHGARRAEHPVRAVPAMSS